MYDEIKSFEQLKAKGIEEMVNFHNYYIDEIEAGNITKNEIKERHNFTFGQVFNYIYQSGNYKIKNKKLVKGQKKEKRKGKEAPTLTPAEIIALKQLVKNGLEDFRSPEHQELIAQGTSSEKKKILFQFSPEVAEKFERYADTHKRFNKSEHIMLAILEYMEKYQ